MDRLCMIGVGFFAVVLVGVLGFFAGGAYFLANSNTAYQPANNSGAEPTIQQTKAPTLTGEPTPVQTQTPSQVGTDATQPTICPTPPPTTVPAPTATACPTPTSTLQPTATPSVTCPAVKTVTMSIPMTEFGKVPAFLEEPTLTVRGPCSWLSIWAPLQLPDGARITQIGFYVADGVPGSDGEHSASLNLFKTHSTDGSGSSWGTVHSVDSKGTYYNYMTIPNALPMNNAEETYSLQIVTPSIASPDQTIMINSVQVQYEIPIE